MAVAHFFFIFLLAAINVPILFGSKDSTNGTNSNNSIAKPRFQLIWTEVDLSIDILFVKINSSTLHNYSYWPDPMSNDRLKGNQSANATSDELNEMAIVLVKYKAVQFPDRKINSSLESSAEQYNLTIAAYKFPLKTEYEAYGKSTESTNRTEIPALTELNQSKAIPLPESKKPDQKITLDPIAPVSENDWQALIWFNAVFIILGLITLALFLKMLFTIKFLYRHRSALLSATPRYRAKYDVTRKAIYNAHIV